MPSADAARSAYRAKHRALRTALNAAPRPHHPDREPLVVAQHAAGRSQALAQFRALTGNHPTHPTPRQAAIACRVRNLAVRLDCRAALDELRAAGASRAELMLASYHLRERVKTPDRIRVEARMMRAVAVGAAQDWESRSLERMVDVLAGVAA